MRRLIGAAVAVALTLVPAGARANLVTQDSCPNPASATLFMQLGSDVLENLAFVNGDLWISDTTANAIRRFDASKTEGTGLTGVTAPGGLAIRDGLIYAGFGDSAAGAVRKTGEAGILKFDPAAPGTSRATVASGFDMANGVAFGPEGEIWTSNDFGSGLVRVDPATGTWTKQFEDVWGMNGLVLDGTRLHAAITFDQRSPIVTIDLDTKTVQKTLQLSVGVASIEPAVYTDPDLGRPLNGVKGLDDMTSDANGVLYTVANGAGELLRVNPATGDACLIVSGLTTPSSVRIAPETSAFADGNTATIDFYMTEFSGAVRVARWLAG